MTEKEAALMGASALLAPHFPGLTPAELEKKLSSLGSDAITRDLTMKEVTNVLGVTRPTVYSMIEDGQLEAYKIRGCRRIKRASVLAVMSEPAT